MRRGLSALLLRARGVSACAFTLTRHPPCWARAAALSQTHHPPPSFVARGLFADGGAAWGWRLFSSSSSPPRPPALGDVRRNSRDPERWRRYDGKRWQNKCAEEGCEKNPSWGLPEDGKRRWCGASGHGPAEKENVVSKRCEAEGCRTFAVFGLPEEGKKRWCGAPGHGPAEKEDVGNKRCEAEGCKTQANWGLPQEGRARWCAAPEHGHAEKVNLLGKRCEAEGCETFAHFGLPDEGKRRWCIKHGPVDTIPASTFP